MQFPWDRLDVFFQKWSEIHKHREAAYANKLAEVLTRVIMLQEWPRLKREHEKKKAKEEQRDRVLKDARSSLSLLSSHTVATPVALEEQEVLVTPSVERQVRALHPEDPKPSPKRHIKIPKDGVLDYLLTEEQEMVDRWKEFSVQVATTGNKVAI